MNLRQIEVFRAFMIAGGVNDAAKLLRVSQPGISKMLRHTEDKLGVKLFERSKGRLLPTPEAHALFAEIEAMWKSVVRVQHRASELASTPSGPLRLVVSPSLGTDLVPAAIAILMHRNPQLQVSVEFITTPQLLEALTDNHADIGVVLFSIDHPNLATRLVAEARLVCVLPAGHRLADRASIAAADISDERLISFSRDSAGGRIIDDAFIAAGLQRNVAIEVVSGQAACWFVRRGAGIALVDEFTLKGDIFPGVVVLPFKPQIAIGAYIVHNRFRPLSHVARSFAEILLSNLKTGRRR
jgi:DNA-binding transcriptional LysR family regulator